PYIDPGRANVDALETIYTIPVAQRPPILVLSELFSSFFTFSPFMVVGNDNGFLVQQNALHPPIVTGYDAYLFPEPDNDKIEDPGKDEQGHLDDQAWQWSTQEIPDQANAPEQIG